MSISVSAQFFFERQIHCFQLHQRCRFQRSNMLISTIRERSEMLTCRFQCRHFILFDQPYIGEGCFLVSCWKRRRSTQLVNTTTLARLWLQPRAHICFGVFVCVCFGVSWFCVELEHIAAGHTTSTTTATLRSCTFTAARASTHARVDARANTHTNTPKHIPHFSLTHTQLKMTLWLGKLCVLQNHC